MATPPEAGAGGAAPAQAQASEEDLHAALLIEVLAQASLTDDVKRRLAPPVELVDRVRQAWADIEDDLRSNANVSIQVDGMRTKQRVGWVLHYIPERGGIGLSAGSGWRPWRECAVPALLECYPVLIQLQAAAYQVFSRNNAHLMKTAARAVGQSKKVLPLVATTPAPKAIPATPSSEADQSLDAMIAAIDTVQTLSTETPDAGMAEILGRVDGSDEIFRIEGGA